MTPAPTKKEDTHVMQQAQQNMTLPDPTIDADDIPTVGARRVGIPAPHGERACSVCGYWEHDACYSEETGPCWWHTDDVCAFCAIAAA